MPSVCGILILAVLSVAVPAHAASGQTPIACAGETCAPQMKDIGGLNLPMRGIKRFEFLKIGLYTAVLYAPGEATGIQDVLSDIPKSLVLHYHRSIRPQDMNRAAWKALEKNPENDIGALRSRVDEMGAAYESVARGDSYELRYEPGRGTSLYRNGLFKCLIPGEDFQRAYFGIWLSEYPLNKDLRDALLGTAKEKRRREG